MAAMEYLLQNVADLHESNFIFSLQMSIIHEHER